MMVVTTCAWHKNKTHPRYSFMRRNVRRLNREINAGLKQPCEREQRKEEPALKVNGRTKRRKAASLTELKRFYDAAIDAASEVLSVTAAATTDNVKCEKGEATIAGKGPPDSASTDGDGQYCCGIALLAASCSTGEHVLPLPFALSTGGSDSRESTEAGEITDTTSCNSNVMNGKASILSEDGAAGERRGHKGADCGDRRFRSPALLLLSGVDANREWPRRGTEGAPDRGIAADSNGDAFREVLRKKLEATGGTQCKLGSTKRLKTNRAATATVENIEVSRHGGGGRGGGGGGGRGGGRGGDGGCASFDAMKGTEGVASGGCPGDGGGGGGPQAVRLLSAGRSGNKTGKGTTRTGWGPGKPQSSSMAEANSSTGEEAIARGPYFPSPVANYPTLPGFRGLVDQPDSPADAGPPRLPLPPRRRGRYTRSSPTLGLSPALLEALEKAETAPHAGAVVSARPPFQKAPFSEYGVDQSAELRFQQAGAANNDGETGSGARWEDAARRPCLKAPFAESSFVKPAEMLLRVCGKDDHSSRSGVGLLRGKHSEEAPGTPAEAAMGAGHGRNTSAKDNSDDNDDGDTNNTTNNNKRCLPDGRAPLMPHWRRREEPPPRLSYDGSSSSVSFPSPSSSSSCSSSAGTNASTSTTASTKRVTFSPSARPAGSGPGSTARTPFAAAARRAARRVTAAAAEDEDDGGYLGENAEEDRAYVGVPVRFGIMQQRQFNRFAGDGRAAPSSTSQQGENAGAGGW